MILPRRYAAAVLATLAVGGLTGCVGPYGQRLPRVGDEIVVCGQLIHTGAPVVLWLDPGGYDAYRAHCHFKPDQGPPSKPVSDEPVRYSSWRRHLPEEVLRQVQTGGWTLPLLQEHVDQFVLHYDACGTSRRCFEVLHDLRGLSVHFMLDLDGTIYQTLDVKERAWHAGTANDRSVGIEIANIGAYTNMDTLEKWYAADEHGRMHVTFPEWLGETGLRNPGYIARPWRNELFIGEINGRTLHQYDFTDAQYESLIKLTATLCRILPRIRPDYPRDAEGHLIRRMLTDEEMAGFSGILGHWHVTDGKVDPGPAFDWDRLIKQTRRLSRR